MFKSLKSLCSYPQPVECFSFFQEAPQRSNYHSHMHMVLAVSDLRLEKAGVARLNWKV